MKTFISAVLFSFTLAAISLPALARQEQWEVSVQGFTSTFHLDISSKGKVTGESEWPTGEKNELTGKIKGKVIKLYRKLEGVNAGHQQKYSGIYINDHTAAKGEYTGLGGPADWQATVTVITP